MNHKKQGLRMNYFILVTALFYSSLALSESVNCEGAPSESVQIYLLP